MKNILLLFLFTLCIISNKAQTIEEDILILKDGSLYRGKIIDSTQAAKIKIECYDRNIYVFNRTDISEIKKGPADLNFSLQRFRYNKKNADLHLPYFEKGFKLNFEAQIGRNISENTSYKAENISLLLNSGYRFNKTFFIGIKSGIRRINNLTINTNIQDPNVAPNYLLINYNWVNRNIVPSKNSIPILLNLEQTFTYDKISSILSLNFGYDYNITNTFENTIDITSSRKIVENFNWHNSYLINPEINLTYSISKTLYFINAIGYTYQKAGFDITQTFYLDFPNTEPNIRRNHSDAFTFQFVYLKIGVGF